jgi:hypothetical protein
MLGLNNGRIINMIRIGTDVINNLVYVLVIILSKFILFVGLRQLVSIFILLLSNNERTNKQTLTLAISSQRTIQLMAEA